MTIIHKIMEANEYLKKMIEHHKTAISMSEMMIKDSIVGELAKKIIEEQTEEIIEMEAMITPGGKSLYKLLSD